MKRCLSLGLLLSLLLLLSYALCSSAAVRGGPGDAALHAASFTPPLNISNSPDYNGTMRPRVARSGDGYLHVVWMEGVNGNYGAAYARGKDTTWPPWEWINPLRNPAYAHPAIALDGQGGTHVVAMANDSVPYDIYYAYRPAEGPWNAPVNLTQDLGISLTGSFYPSIAVDGQGGVWVAWVTISEDNTEIWVRHKPFDGNWDPAQRITTNNERDLDPTIAVDGAGVPHLAWRNNGAGNFEILYTRCEGGSWTAPLNLSSTPLLSFAPRLAANDLGDVFAVWTDEIDSADDFDILFCRWDGTQWSPWQQISDSPKALYPAIAAAGDDLYVVWQDYRDSSITEVYFSHSTDGGITWQGEENVSQNNTSSFFPDVAAQPGGRVYIVWADMAPGQLDIFYSQGVLSGSAVPLESVAISGPTLLRTREMALYTAAYTPITATLPVTLTWDNGTAGPSAVYAWTMPGDYTVTVTAANECGEIPGAMTVIVRTWIYLPAVQRGP